MRTILGLSAFILIGACSGSDAATGKSGPDGTMQFPVGTFDAIALEGSDDVKVVTGPTGSVVARGPADELAKLVIRVEGTTLKIGRKNENYSMGWSASRGVTVTVTTPGIKAAAIGGSGDMTIDRVRGGEFKGSIGGSGDLDIADIDVPSAGFSIAGSGNMRVVGKAVDTSFSLAGSGDIDAGKLAGATADISIAGSGNVSAAASKSAKIAIVGSGDAMVSGTANCAISQVGSGEVKCTP